MALQHAIYKDVMESGDMAWLDRLSYTKDASHLAGHRKMCLPGTRTEILRKIEYWIKDPIARRVYWLNGIAGIGKTTIAQTIAELTFEIRLLGASFFCSRDFAARRELVHIFCTLAFQLACQYTGFRSHLVDAIKSRPDIASYSLSEQFQQLLLGPLLRSSLETVIIIDALDECIDYEPASALLSVLAQYVDQLPLVKFFITGRPEPQIKAGFRVPSLRPHTETMVLHKIEPSSVDRDVATYFHARFSELVAVRTDVGLGEGWPGEQDIAILVCRSSGLFIYAETMFRFINLKNRNPPTQLLLIINSPDTGVNKALLPVDTLYSQILHLGYNDIDSYREEFRIIVGSIVLLFDPMSVDDLALLLNRDPMDVSTSINSLHSLLVVPDQTSDFIRIMHTSFPDYITDPKRCTDDRFRIDSSTHHAEMTLQCLNLMNKVLKRNICDLPRYAMNDDVSDLSERKKRFIGDALEYACKFWADHLHMAKISDKELISKIVASLGKFFQRDSLPWLEVLSILGKLAVAVHALNKVVQWLSVRECDAQEASAATEDLIRFTLLSFDVIKLSSQHVYHSGLAWCPSSSLTRTLYQHELGLEVNVMHGIEFQWASCIRSIPIMRNPSENFEVRAIAISRRDDMIAFGGLGNRYHISDAASGSVISVLQGSAEATSVTFSADGSLFASGDEGGDIRVWDIQTGIYKVLFQGGKENRAQSVAFAPKGTLLASGNDDGNVRIWDVISEELPLHRIMQAHADYVTSVSWSSEGSKVLSGSPDMSMKIWDASTGDCLHIIQAERWIDCVAWSPDGSKFGLSTMDKIAIYDAQTYDQLGCFQTNGMGIRKSFDFSSKGDHVVYGSGKLVLVRNLNLAIDVSNFVGHTDGVGSVAFSAGATFVISGGEDGLIKVWRFGSEEQGSNHEQERSEVPAAVSFSPSGRLMATATRGKREVELWNPVTCSHFDTLFLELEQVGLYPCLAFSPDSSLIACGFGPDKLIRIWDVNTRAVISDLHCYVSIFDLFCLAPDGNRLGVVELGGRVIQLWDVRQGNIIAALTWSESIAGRKITFCEDGSGILITRYVSDPIKLDIITSSNGSLPFELVASSNESPRVILNHDLYRLSEHPYDWVLDSKNRRVCWVPPDQRLNPSTVGDSNGSKIAWSSHKELIYLDFSHVPTAEKE